MKKLLRKKLDSEMDKDTKEQREKLFESFGKDQKVEDYASQEAAAKARVSKLKKALKQRKAGKSVKDQHSKLVKDSPTPAQEKLRRMKK